MAKRFKTVKINIDYEPKEADFIEKANEFGYQINSVNKIPPAIANELSIAIAIEKSCEHIREGSEFFLQLPIPNSKPIKVKKINGKIMGNFKAMADAVEMPEDQRIDTCQMIFSQMAVFPWGMTFSHPLAKEGWVGDKLGVNSWKHAETIINSIMYPQGTPDRGKIAEESFRQKILLANSNVDIDTLLIKVKARIIPACQMACSLIAQGIEIDLEAGLHPETGLNL
ncbi:hypothetical protein [Moorena sp. SIO4G3]|uniref:hypothetical protein n=1 Tax=Moorena sp. SIO4G3 TaxID=2607821 RepID=UPI00142B1745|nr:hypothetical protein [Moorena sp. SIO4G3]NEO77546.1 hypothetical protein [Moorena sp. SIO4G3]